MRWFADLRKTYPCKDGSSSSPFRRGPLPVRFIQRVPPSTTQQIVTGFVPGDTYSVTLRATGSALDVRIAPGAGYRTDTMACLWSAIPSYCSTYIAPVWDSWQALSRSQDRTTPTRKQVRHEVESDPSGGHSSGHAAKLHENAVGAALAE
jgi:hypothetical protein